MTEGETMRVNLVGSALTVLAVDADGVERVVIAPVEPDQPEADE